MTPIELRARREALGLSQTRLADALSVNVNVNQVTVSRWESGARSIPPTVEGELAELEELVDGITDGAIAESDRTATETGLSPVLFTHSTDEGFWAAHPDMKPLPAVLHRVAIAHAALATGDRIHDLDTP